MFFLLSIKMQIALLFCTLCIIIVGICLAINTSPSSVIVVDVRNIDKVMDIPRKTYKIQRPIPPPSVDVLEEHVNIDSEFVESCERFMRLLNLTSIVDFGCGQMLAYLPLVNDNFIGVDKNLVKIEENTKKYPDFSFLNVNFLTSVKELPSADIILFRDVFQHLSNDSIRQVVSSTLTKYKYMLICNRSTYDDNFDIVDGGFRFINMFKQPFTSYVNKDNIILLNHYKDDESYRQLVAVKLC
jgi:hypothetical protein